MRLLEKIKEWIKPRREEVHLAEVIGRRKQTVYIEEEDKEGAIYVEDR